MYCYITHCDQLFVSTYYLQAIEADGLIVWTEHKEHARALPAYMAQMLANHEGYGTLVAYFREAA